MTRDKFFGEGARRRWRLFKSDYDDLVTGYDSLEQLGPSAAALIKKLEEYVQEQGRTIKELCDIVGVSEEEYAAIRQETFLHAAKEKWEEATRPKTPDDDKMFEKILRGLEGNDGIRTPFRRADKEARGTFLLVFERHLADSGLPREEALAKIGLTDEQVTEFRESRTFESRIRPIDEPDDEGPTPPSAG